MVDPLVGRTIAQYEILARRGGGGMGVVYEARDTKLGRRVALKFLPPQWSHDEAAKQRFVREAQAASATDHPNICTIHDIAATDDGQLFIVMAFYAGETLKQRLAGGALPVHEALDVATQVADGLARAHAKGVVHRDIKPGNLILTEDGVRIVDFGLATFVDALQLTVPGTTLGTAAYMSPEQTRGEEADARADVWAAGVILYEMLAGHVPFRGAYAEAIAYAIRNDPPPSLRAVRPEVPEEVEQLVFRALHKDRAIRYQNGRELARALRQARGFTVPMDLRTQAVDVPAAVQAVHGAPRRTSRRLWAGAGTFALAAVVGAVWLLWPFTRVPVVVAPIVNETGYPELNGLRMPLTLALAGQLADAEAARVVPYQRVLPATRRLRGGVRDVSSREVVQQMAAHTGAQFVIVPTLRYSDGDQSWRVRVEVQRADTLTAELGFETAPIFSALKGEAAFELIREAASGVRQHLLDRAPIRVRVAAALRAMTGRDAPLRPQVTSIDAAVAFERGMDAYEQQEYDGAVAAFAMAAQHDAGNPLMLTWESRAALMMRQGDIAARSAQQALTLLSEATPPSWRLFVEAVAAESRREFADAADRYQELMDRYPDESTWQVEFAGLLDRQADVAGAIEAYRGAREAEPSFVRADLELCRLYNRVRDPGKSREHAQLAMERYRALGDASGEAQALLCLTDTLRVGGVDRVVEAARAASRALELFQALNLSYNVARAHHYVALTADAQGDLTSAVSHWDQALAQARATRNRLLEATVLLNLGVTHERLGNRARALDFHRESHALHASLGNERGGAYSQANVGALLIASGHDPDQGFREVQNALRVVQKIGDRGFEIFALRTTAAYHRYAGRLDASERELNLADTIARDRQVEDEIGFVAADLARIRLEQGRYAAARDLLVMELAHASGPSAMEMRIALARAYVRLGDTPAARRELSTAAAAAAASGDTAFMPFLYLVSGETEYEGGNFTAARKHLEQAAALWIDELPDPSSVEAGALLALLNVMDGRETEGIRLVMRSLDQATAMKHRTLEVLCRIIGARIELAVGRPAAALRALRGDWATPNPEVQAQLQYWRGQALMRSGDPEAARNQEELARATLAHLISLIPEPDRPRIEARRDLRAIIG
jgi:tetratricopeptide (TPR) repeat protein